ncbi:hypothetical protein [Gracilibacillus sp. YIM 98692]|uniref:hypothetical protein n=1 Tax=Gracilibacillus sp. YIM 98692 TaxID=2663532 RepID=UPI0013D585D0|nr:hypothetical protein [Gracilibacillus sp. YIM 98692]
MKNSIIICLFLILFACSKQEEEPLVVKEEPEEPIEDLIEKEELTEKPIENENFELKFLLEDEVISLNTENISILKSYLSTFDDANRKQVIEQMELKKLPLNHLYLLSFSCQSETCSYLLLDRGNPNRSFLLDDFVYIKDITVAPDKNSLIFVMEQLDTDYMVSFYLPEWKTIPLQPSVKLTQHKRVKSLSWIDNDTIQAEVQIIADNNRQQLEFSLIKDEKDRES